jgi:hypothetical protein
VTTGSGGGGGGGGGANSIHREGGGGNVGGNSSGGGGSGGGGAAAAAASVLLKPLGQGGTGRVVATVVSPAGFVTTVDPASRADTALAPRVVVEAARGVVTSSSSLRGRDGQSGVAGDVSGGGCAASSSEVPDVPLLLSEVTAAAPAKVAATAAVHTTVLAPPLSFVWSLEVVQLPECAPLEEAHQATSAAVRKRKQIATLLVPSFFLLLAECLR